IIMLLRLITVISLINFLLLMVSGMDIGTAVHRSLIVFMLLFTVVYLTIFFINVIKDNSDSSKSTVAEMDSSKNNKET
ncbi:MAG TPA: hypothetical protein VJ951_00745, partial [Bacteroidales bacterium]|nr:hypothetical protein [Bacteroidales bacterium]